MKKRILILAFALVLLLALIPVMASASTLTAAPTASTVYLNDAVNAFEAYNIGGNNYFKLRDLAYVLNGTAKQFEVGYDNATKAITLISSAYLGISTKLMSLPEQGDTLFLTDKSTVRI